MNRSLLLPVLLLALAACQTPETEPAEREAAPVANVSDPAEDRAAIEAIVTEDYTAAARAGDHAAISALYTDDAVIHPANEPSVSGREALDAYFAAIFAEPFDVTYSIDDVVVAESGDMAYMVGTWGDGHSKFLSVYRRTADGWRIVADSWSYDAPPTATN